MGHPTTGGQPHLPPLHGFKSTAASRNAGKVWTMEAARGLLPLPLQLSDCHSQ